MVSAGTWVTKLLPDLPVMWVRKIFAWQQADGDYYYGFPAEENELKLNKHRLAFSNQLNL